MKEFYYDLGHGNAFLDIISKAQFMKEIIDKLDFTKITNICSAKDNVKGMIRQAADWEKIFTKKHI